MLSWLLKKSSNVQEPTQATLRQRGIRNNVFFRLDTGVFRDAELPTQNEDVPQGAPILHHICYELPLPWCAHAITVSVWSANITAKIGRNKDCLYDLFFSDWDDGWRLSIDPPVTADESEIRELISAIHVLVKQITGVRDVRWFHDDTLTCRVFHAGDFDLGTETPFDAESTSK